MEKIHAINPQRIVWCCNQQGLTIEMLSKEVGIALATLEKALRGNDALSVNQLRKIASYFNRGMLFFLEHEPVKEEKLLSAQFRTLTNQKPTLSPKLSALIERIEKQRQVYISLLEDLGDDADNAWFPDELLLDCNKIKQSALEVRQWLGLSEKSSLNQLRNAVESKGIMVFISNGYQGQWQIAKENPVRGFSLFYPILPIIAIKKQSANGPQAFTLMHELAHLLLHKKSVIDDEEDFFSYQGKERAANQLAGNVLVPDPFLIQIDLNHFPYREVSGYDDFLKRHCEQWCVSSEVILRRLLDSDLLPLERYQAYRAWKLALPVPKPQPGGVRYRYREPIRIFGEPFVRTVLEALHGKKITLAKASSYLDNLKISDIHQLETRVHF